MENISRKTLIKAAKGDLPAFEDIYKIASGFVYATALRRTGNRTDAEDITQEVFLTLHRKLAQFRFRSSFKTWLYRVTTNCALNAVKKRWRTAERSEHYEIVLETTPSRESTDKSISQIDNKELVSSLLQKLNPDQRTCIVLRELEGLSYKEIAKALRIKINTVRSRLKRAREALLAFSTSGEVYHEM